MYFYRLNHVLWVRQSSDLMFLSHFAYGYMFIKPVFLIQYKWICYKHKISLPDLRGTEIWLKIMIQVELIKPSEKAHPIYKVTDQLFSILFKGRTLTKKTRANVNLRRALDNHVKPG